MPDVPVCQYCCASNPSWYLFTERLQFKVVQLWYSTMCLTLQYARKVCGKYHEFVTKACRNASLEIEEVSPTHGSPVSAGIARVFLSTEIEV